MNDANHSRHVYAFLYTIVIDIPIFLELTLHETSSYASYDTEMFSYLP